MAADTQNQKKNRISAIFGNKKSREDIDCRPLPTTGANGNSADSAYASSDPPSQHSTSPESRHANMVSIENNGQISGVDGSRHLQLNQKTGEVLDEDTGEVVTTVTTTTTTTTTTVKKGGLTGENKGTTVQVDTWPGHTSQAARSTHPHIAEAPGDGPALRFQQPQNTAPQHLRDRSPIPPQLQVGRQQQMQAPPEPISPPMRNPDRKSREYARPPSPLTPGAQGRHNFSYPSRSDLKSQEHSLQIPLQRQTTHERERGGAFENLKAAAVGLHGVGETLRGTLNSEVDARLSRRNPDKAAAVNSKNRVDVERGQQEMARLRKRNGSQPTILRPQQNAGDPQQQQDGRVSQTAPQIPPMNAGQGGPVGSNWDAPGTWGSGRVAEMKGPQALSQEVHPALRGQGQGQPQHQEQRDPQYAPHISQQMHGNSRYSRMDGTTDTNGNGDGNGMGQWYPSPGVAGAGEGNPAANVQAVSHVQGNSNQEPDERRGLRKLFKRKGVGAS